MHMFGYTKLEYWSLTITKRFHCLEAKLITFYNFFFNYFLMTALSIILVHLLIKFKFHYLPESVAVVGLGVLIGLVSLLMKNVKIAEYNLTVSTPCFTGFLSLNCCYFVMKQRYFQGAVQFRASSSAHI